MNGATLSFMLLGALALILVACAVEDIRQRTIAHWKYLGIAALAPLWWWSQSLAPWPDIALQIALAIGIFALFLIPYAIGQMGGGDLKLLVALALWLPWAPMVQLLILMSLLGLAVTVIAIVEHRWRGRPGKSETPYGVAIALAGLIMLREPLFYQFA